MGKLTPNLAANLLIEVIESYKPWLWEVRASGELSRCQMKQACIKARIDYSIVLYDEEFLGEVQEGIKSYFDLPRIS